MMRRLILCVGIALLFGVIGYGSLLLGSYVSVSTGSNILGLILSLPGIVFILPALPFTFLIDYLPMGIIFPKGGASGVFGSLMLFAHIIWGVAFGFFAAVGKWPFRTLTRRSSKDALKRAA